jgi:hypothetical protein
MDRQIRILVKRERTYNRNIQRTRAAVLAGAKGEKHGANNTKKKRAEK